MTTWALILTLAFNAGASYSPSVAAVGGFYTRQACLDAGNAWLATVHHAGWSASALCMPQSQQSVR